MIIPVVYSGLPLARLGLQIILASANEHQLLKMDARTSLVMLINQSEWHVLYQLMGRTWQLCHYARSTATKVS